LRDFRILGRSPAALEVKKKVIDLGGVCKDGALDEIRLTAAAAVECGVKGLAEGA